MNVLFRCTRNSFQALPLEELKNNRARLKAELDRVGAITP
jgi:hypothetical protein